MKILFILPPNNYTPFLTNLSIHPVHLLTSAAFLLEGGHNVHFLDLENEPVDEDDFLAFLKKILPEVAVIYANTERISLSHIIASIIKKHHPGINTVICGTHVSAIPERTMQEFPYFDYGVSGEPDSILFDFCAELEKKHPPDGVPGIIFRNKSKITVNQCSSENSESLNLLPLPARDLLDFKRYRPNPVFGLLKNPIVATPLITARGCSKKNLFMAADEIISSKPRLRSPANIHREVIESNARYFTNYFSVSDDTLLLNIDRFTEIAQNFKRAGVKWGFKTSAALLSMKAAEYAAQNGCLKITIFFSPAIKKKMQEKDQDFQKNVKTIVQYLQKSGIVVYLQYLYGCSMEETTEKIRESFQAARDWFPNILSVSQAVPFPGTDLYKELSATDMIYEYDWSKFSFLNEIPVWQTEYITPEVSAALKLRCMENFYFSTQNVGRIIRNFRVPGALSFNSRLIYSVYSRIKEVKRQFYKDDYLC